MAGSRPLVCICVPTYNAAVTLAETLDSILAQTYPAAVVMVVDNASTDDTVAIAHRYAATHRNVEVMTHAENVGGEGNFTRCIQLCRGDYTAIYHADDLYEPNMVERQVAFLEQHQDAGVVLTGARHIDAEGRESGIHFFPPELCGRGEVLLDLPELLKSVLRYSNFLICPSAMARTSVYRNEIRVWDGQKYGTSADLDVWFRIAQKHKLGIITAPLMRYRVSRYSHSYRYTRTRTTPHDILRVLDDYVGRYRETFLDKDDLKRYDLFFLKDAASRALNALINDDRRQARRIAREAFTGKNLTTATSAPRGFLYALAGCAALLLSLFPIGQAGRRALQRLKFG
jgi:glycosyltransferase involved in cell wall biosynthesis